MSVESDFDFLKNPPHYDCNENFNHIQRAKFFHSSTHFHSPAANDEKKTFKVDALVLVYVCTIHSLKDSEWNFSFFAAASEWCSAPHF
jgi:hypothetical protein